jgi:hypothetical protein
VIFSPKLTESRRIGGWTVLLQQGVPQERLKSCPSVNGRPNRFLK